MKRTLTPLTQTCILVAIALVVGLTLDAQDAKISIPFHRLAQDQGLQDLNNAFVTKDSRGYIWISSFENGLFRYDGRSFRNYKADPTDSTSIGANMITSPCFEDENGDLWFSSYDAINRYIRQQDVFQTYRIRDSLGNKLENFYTAFHLDQQKNLWIRLDEEGGVLYHFNTQTGDATYQHQMLGQRFSVVEDENGRVSSVVSSMFYPLPGAKQYDYDQSGKLTTEESLLTTESLNTEVFTYQSYLSTQGTTWLGTTKGLARLHSKRNSRDSPDFFSSFQGNSIGTAWSIVPLQEQYLLVSTSRLGLLLFDLAQEAFIQRIAHEENDPFRLKSNRLHELYMDQDEILWVTSYGMGLHYGSPNKKKFDLASSNSSPGSASMVGYLAEDGKGGVWGMKGKGQVLYFKDNFTNAEEVDFSNTEFESTATQSSLFNGQKGKVWFANGPELFLLQGRALVLIDSFDTTVDNLIELRSGKTLISTADGSFILEPIGSDQYDRRLLSVPEMEGNPWFTTAIQDSEGQVYLSLEFERIAVFKESSEGLEQIKIIKSPSYFLGAYEDIANDCIWLSTTIGLGKLNKQTYQFQPVDLGVELGTCWGLFGDQDNNLWLSNGTGLHRYSIDDDDFHTFSAADGSLKTGYGRYSFLKRSNGEMWFGGPEGISVVDPKDVDFITTAPKIHLTNLRVHGEAYQMPDSTVISEAGSFELEPGQNYLEFEFIALEYSDPSAIRYQYQLDQYDRDWIDAGSSTRAAYQKLPPGAYTFAVRATNADGRWSDPHKISITIQPWFYQTTWFKGAMALVILLGAWWAYQAQLKRRLREEAVKNLQELNNYKSRFFTSITHEFRSPLNIILSYLNTALTKNKGLKRGNLEIMQRSGQQLLNLVNQILDLRRLEVAKTQINYEKLDLANLTESVVENFQKLAYGKGIQLSIENQLVNGQQLSDREKLRKILSNLISNAIKFTARGGKVLVKVSETEQQFQFQVVDTGIGISPDKIPYIFDQFYQAHDESTNKFGSGVGLALSKELIKALGGDIKVHSELGNGSTFTATLPVSAESPQENTDGQADLDLEDFVEGEATLTPSIGKENTQELAEILQAEAEAEDNGKQLILIAEDNVNFQSFIKECLDPHYRVVIRKDGKEAWEATQRLIPDLIISDLKMPYMDGYQFTRAVKTHAATSHIPVILLTGLEDIDARVKGIQEGADIYLNKPFHEEELLSWIQNLLRLRAKLQLFYREIGVSITDEPVQQNEGHDPDRVFIQKVMVAIDQNYHKDTFSVKELSEMMNMEYVTFYRKFKAIMNENAKKTIQDKRLTKAKELLLSEPSKRIREIAFEVGFSDPGYFSKAFKEMEQMSPKKFREEYPSNQ